MRRLPHLLVLCALFGLLFVVPAHAAITDTSSGASVAQMETGPGAGTEWLGYLGMAMVIGGSVMLRKARKAKIDKRRREDMMRDKNANQGGDQDADQDADPDAGGPTGRGGGG